MIMIRKTVNIADAKKHFSDLLGRVANDKNLAQAKGWLAEDDPFFKTMERIVQSRSKHTSRLFTDVKPK
jgi:hypothetical protein